MQFATRSSGTKGKGGEKEGQPRRTPEDGGTSCATKPMTRNEVVHEWWRAFTWLMKVGGKPSMPSTAKETIGIGNHMLCESLVEQYPRLAFDNSSFLHVQNLLKRVTNAPFRNKMV